MYLFGLVRLIRDPESRQAGSSTVAKFTVVENKKRGDKEVSTFIDCEAWGKLGETAQNHLTKGTRIVLTAELEQQNWEKEGEKKSKLVAKVADFRFVDAKAKVEGGEDSNPGGNHNSNGGDEDHPF